MRARHVVRVPLGRRDVAVSHPLLQCPQLLGAGAAREAPRVPGAGVAAALEPLPAPRAICALFVRLEGDRSPGFAGADGVAVARGLGDFGAAVRADVSLIDG